MAMTETKSTSGVRCIDIGPAALVSLLERHPGRWHKYTLDTLLIFPRQGVDRLTRAELEELLDRLQAGLDWALFPDVLAPMPVARVR